MDIIKKDNPLMPMMMEMMSQMMPTQIPEMQFSSDPITKFFQNLALRQIAKNEALKAEISTSKRTQAGNNMATMREAITFSETVFEDIQQKKNAQELRKVYIQTAEANRDKVKAEAESIKLKNELTKMEIKNSLVDFRFKLKEMGLEEE